MSPLDGFADSERWVCWREEPRKKDGKPTKVPYQTNGSRASSTAPKTWANRKAAKDAIPNVVNGHLRGGIGIVLGDLGNSMMLAGIDLDTCRHADGTFEPWAQDVIDRFRTYTEISPSGTGAKLFFLVPSEAYNAIRHLLSGKQTGKTFKKPGNNDHPPGVEIYFSDHFFTVTEALLEGCPDAPATIGQDDLDWLLNTLGPSIVPKAEGSRARARARSTDQSRSGAVFATANRYLRQRKSFEDFCEAVRTDPKTAEWYSEKGVADNNRELHRAWEHATQQKSDVDATIEIVAGDRHLAADQGIEALVQANVQFYQRDHKLQRVAPVKAKNTNGEIMMIPGIVPVDAPIMNRKLGQSAVWKRHDMRKKELVVIDPPNAVGAQILSMVGEWPFAPLNGIIQCPTLRCDGTLLDKPGYDEATALFLTDHLSIPKIPNEPTREHAEQALELLSGLLSEFPFVDSESKAVALSMLLTPVVRGAMPVAPMHLIVKPTPGTGASYLTDCAAMIATGERCAVESMAPKYEETEKRLVGSALSGRPIIALDNCRDIIAGSFFCQIVERPLMELRALGSSDKHIIPNTFTMFCNGNNPTVADDMVRRTLRCRLDANCENPEKREFKGNPLKLIRRNRGDYVAAALTIPLAYLAAGSPNPGRPLASFEEWSSLVRDPLVWLGYKDPVGTQDELRNDDPHKAEQFAVFNAWKNVRTPSPINNYTTKQLIQEAIDHGELFDALYAVAPLKFSAERKIDPKELGKWLVAHLGNIAAGCKLGVNRNDAARPKWYLEFVGSVGSVG